jgi:phosphoribosylanthranilate isomerase
MLVPAPFCSDTFVAGVPGGTGEIFDWSLIPADLPKPLILAGGLTCENVQQAVAEVRPFAVGCEWGSGLSKGIKDAASVREFVRLVRASM